MDIIRTFTKITNSFILKLTGPVHIIKRPSLFYVSIEMPAHVLFWCFCYFLNSHLFNQVINDGLITMCDWLVVHNEWIGICGIIWGTVLVSLLGTKENYDNP